MPKILRYAQNDKWFYMSSWTEWNESEGSYMSYNSHLKILRYAQNDEKDAEWILRYVYAIHLTKHG